MHNLRVRRKNLVSKKRVDGQNILYHYLQKILLNDDEFSVKLISNLLIDLSIWLPHNLYAQLPILLPYVLRDPKCRKNPDTGEDEWGSSDENGLLRDDNSLIKGIPKSFEITSSRISQYNKRKFGNGFVASHIWREITLNNHMILASRSHMFNSFVPNLVWLPVQISKFTDREGSIAQKVLQTLSYRIYRETKLPKIIEDKWENLPQPEEFRDMEIDLKRISYFKVTDKWINKRIFGLKKEIETIISIDENKKNQLKKVKCSRYLPRLKQISKEKRQPLNDWLTKYDQIL